MTSGFVLWLTGLSGAGKSTLSQSLVPRLKALGWRVEVLDGDAVRPILSGGLGYTREDRNVNVARIAWVAELLARNGVAVLVAAISPYAEARERAKSGIERFAEVHVHCSIDELARRDVKGLYRKAMAGEIAHFTGVSDPYEVPQSPDAVVDSGRDTIEEGVEIIEAMLRRKGFIA